MVNTSWRQILNHFRHTAARRGRRPERPLRPHRPWLEVLEARLAPTVTLSVSDPAPFPKPDSGQLMGIFVITRSGDLAPAVSVIYQTRDGVGPTGARAGVDYVATSGSLTIPAMETTATVSVPILGNNLFQVDKTFTLRLSSPLPRDAFVPPRTFDAGGAPSSVAVGDFNGDGKPDLAVANSASFTQMASVTVLLNTTPMGTATPSFAPPQTLETGVNAGSVVVADFNGDGKPDLAVTYSDAFHGSVAVFLNTTPAGATTASFAPPLTFATDTSSLFYPVGMAVGDFNGDGQPDLAIANVNPFGPGSLSVLINTTPAGATIPSFAPQRAFAAGGVPVAVAVGDINGDGQPDVVVANRFFSTVSVLLDTTPAGATVPSFTPQQTFATGSGPEGVAVGDFNGDGLPDLAVANNGVITGGPPSVSVLLNTTPVGSTTPSFAPQQTYLTGNGPSSVVVGDFTGDGQLDLAVANNNSGTVSVLLGNGDGSFQPAVSFFTSVNPLAVAVADVINHDKPDLILGGVTGVSVLVNNAVPVTITGSPATGTISSAPEAPASITVVPGTTPQSATVGTAFAVPLAVDVFDAAGNPVQGVSVIFTAPRRGPSGTFDGQVSAGVLSDANGRATAPDFVANTIEGSYRVKAQAAGGSNPIAHFQLTNTADVAVALRIITVASTTPGAPFDVTVIAADPYGNTDTNYHGTIHFSTTDADAGVVLPADYTLQSGSGGQATFPGGATLITPGSQILTVTDDETGIDGRVTITVM
jgi:hypothetical protein